MCKIVAYLRVSTTEKSAKQDYERQRYLLEHSGLVFDEIYEEHISGGIKGEQREQFNKMLESLDEKDLVCLTETSRFGRNYIDCFEMLDLITQKKKASVKFLSNGIALEGGEKMNPYTWMTVSQFFIQDEFLKRQIGYNTSNALQRKKEQGIVLGHPVQRDTANDQKIRAGYKAGRTLKDLAVAFGLSVATVHRIVKERKIAGN
ncbi:MAG: recombinase family protein [Bacteroidales bacterium]|nr:recombinase family protein [Bacteroidales bacterium]